MNKRFFVVGHISTSESFLDSDLDALQDLLIDNFGGHFRFTNIEAIQAVECEDHNYGHEGEDNE